MRRQSTMADFLMPDGRASTQDVKLTVSIELQDCSASSEHLFGNTHRPFERHVAIQFRIVGFEDLAHTALAERFEQHVATQRAPGLCALARGHLARTAR